MIGQNHNVTLFWFGDLPLGRKSPGNEAVIVIIIASSVPDQPWLLVTQYSCPALPT